MNIWLYNRNKNLKAKDKLNRQDFFNEYPFSFCISKKEITLLPAFIKKDVVKFIKDDKTGIFFYVLDNSKKLKELRTK